MNTIKLSHISNAWIADVLAENIIKNCDYFINRANQNISDIYADIEILVDQVGVDEATNSPKGQALATRLDQQEQNLAEWTEARVGFIKQGLPEPKDIKRTAPRDLSAILKAKAS